MASRRSWCARALLLPALVLGCGGDDLGPRIPAAIVVTPNEPHVPLGQTKQLTATVVDAGGRAIDGQPLSYTSGSPEIITVSAQGLLTAVGSLGTATIEVASGELTTTIEADAVLPPSAIVVEPRTLALQASQSAYLSVTVTNELSEPVSVAVGFASGNPLVATVDGSGLVTAVLNGSTEIVISSAGRADVHVPVTVSQIPTSIRVTPSNLVLAPGQEQPLSAQVLDAFGQLISGAPLGYSSSATGVATVSSAGVVHAVANGSATIFVTSNALSTAVGLFVGDAPSGTVLATVALEGAPWGARVVGNRFFVTGTGGRLYGGQGTPFSFPSALTLNGLTLDVAVNAAGTRAYVASVTDALGAQGVGVVDLAAQSVIEVLYPSSPNSVLAVALTPDESALFIGTGSGVEKIDLATKAATPVPGVAASVTAFSRHPTQPWLYGNVGYGLVAEIDRETGMVLRTFDPIALGSTGAVQGTAISLDATRLYAAVENGDLLSWDLATGAGAERLTAGGGFGMAVSPDNALLYVAHGSAVLLVDRASLTLLKTLVVGGSVRRVAVRPDGVALAANEAGWVDFIK
ncbi:MAG TPA: Ig-like domain-containing protein [Gemmatimonadales bacterium]|nr:Ig-like domain-containing protein [Gemmatimonadales bacterium]